MPTIGQKAGFAFCGDSAVSRLQWNCSHSVSPVLLPPSNGWEHCD